MGGSTSVCVQSGIHAAHRSAETEEGPARDTIRLGLELEDAANISGNVGHGGGGRQGAAQNGLRQHFLRWMTSPRETEKIPLYPRNLENVLGTDNQARDIKVAKEADLNYY